MSNQVTVFQSKMPSLAGLFDEISNLIKPQFDSYPQLSIKGSKFHCVIDGEPNTMKDEDGVPLSSLNVIIVGSANNRARVMYEGKFDPAKAAAPDCHSMNGATPDLDIDSPAHDNCKTCPKLQKVMGDDGKERAPCQQVKYLAVIIQGQEKVYRLRLPVTSLYDKTEEKNGYRTYDAYCDWLRKQGVPHTGVVVTKMIFDSDAEYPRLRFKALTDEDGNPKFIPEKTLVEKIVPTIKSDLVREMIAGTERQVGSSEDAPKQVAAQQPVQESKSVGKAPEKVEEAPKPKKAAESDGFGFDEPAPEPKKAEKPAKKEKPKVVEDVDNDVSSALLADWD